MQYTINQNFTQIAEKEGVMQNLSVHAIEIITSKTVPDKNSIGLTLSNSEKICFKTEDNIYIRCTQPKVTAMLAVVNFNKPASSSSNGAGGSNNGNRGDTGDIIYAHVLKLDYVKLNGAQVNRSDYPLLYQFAASNHLIVTEVEWNNGMQGLYSEGDSQATFRLPDFRGQFLRGLDEGAGIDTGRVLGSSQGDAIRNITGIVTRAGGSVFGAGSTTGCFNIVPELGGVWGNNLNTYTANSIDFDASRVVPTAKENRPRNIALIAQVKYR